MEAKELMIGDWVDYRDKYIQVTSLYDKGGSNEIGWGDKESTWVNGRTIKPIPLTKEILQTNGILYQWGSPWFQHTDNYEVEFEVHFTYNCHAVLRYVHELQHALRLFKIKKEIILNL